MANQSRNGGDVMEENTNIINNEENNYDVIVIEDKDEVIYEETVQVVQIDEPEFFTVGTDSAFVALGETNETLNHALLHNRDLDEQHPIKAITGLREELDGIHALKTVESDKRGYANYYMWKDEQSAVPSNKVGYFVSIHTRDHKVSICDDNTEIFGVTVGSAGFVGGQRYDELDNPQYEEYVLVANTGVVKVQCLPSVVAGDYVMSANDGRAKKTDNEHGYYVISIDDSDGTRHAVISLDSTMNQVYDLSEEVDKFNERIDIVEIQTEAAISAATKALKQSLESSVNSALQNSQNALDNVNSALDKVTDLEDGLTGVSGRVDAIQDNIVIAIQDKTPEIVGAMIDDVITTSQGIENIRTEIGTVQKDVETARADISSLSDAMQILDSFNEDDYKGVAGIVASAEDSVVQLAAIAKCSSNNYEILETWNRFDKKPSKVYYVKDEELYYYYDAETGDWPSTSDPTKAGLSEVLAGIRQNVNKNEAMVENLTSYIGRDYEIIPVWNRYAEVDAWNRAVADVYIIYYDTYTEKYYQCDLSILDRDPWGYSNTIPDGFEPLTDDDVEKIYYAEDSGRYYYYDDGWKSTESPSVAGLVESIALTKQLANKNEARINDIVSFTGKDGAALAEIKQKADNNEASINSLTSYVQKNYTELDAPWDASVRTEDDRVNIYYALDPTDNIWKYWYWKEEDQTPSWVGSPNPSDAGLVASIVNVQQQASSNGASIAALQSWQGTTNDAIASLKSSVGADGASIESLVMNISKYTVGKYSQAYGLTVAEAQELLRDGTVFVPSENTKESYKKEDDTYKERLFSRGFYYVWNKNDGVWYDGGNVKFITSYIRDNDAEYVVIEEGYTYSVVEADTKNNVTNPSNFTIYYFKDELAYYYYYNKWYPAQDPNFEVGALYEWDVDKELWQKVATLESNTLNRAISQIRQTENSIESSVADVEGNLSRVEQRVTDVESTYVTTTTFNDNLTQIKQEANDNSATLSLLVSSGIISVDTWSSAGKDTSKVYYNKSNKSYYYYLNGGTDWNKTTSITDVNIAAKIRSAGIITAINNDKSEIKISGDKVSITAEAINLAGAVTFEDLKNANTNSDGTLKTVINGSNITTGVIKSNGYNKNNTTGFANTGTEINLKDGSITSKNFKIDSNGDASLIGTFTTSNKSGKQIKIDGYSINLFSNDTQDSAAISFCTTNTTWESTGSDADLALAGVNNIIFGCRPKISGTASWTPMCSMMTHATNTSGKPTKVSFRPDITGLLGTENNRWFALNVNNIDCDSSIKVESTSANGVNIVHNKVQVCKDISSASSSSRVELNSDNADGCSIWFKNGDYYGSMLLNSSGQMQFSVPISASANNFTISKNLYAKTVVSGTEYTSAFLNIPSGYKRFSIGSSGWDTYFWVDKVKFNSEVEVDGNVILKKTVENKEYSINIYPYGPDNDWCNPTIRFNMAGKEGSLFINTDGSLIYQYNNKNYTVAKVST